MSKAVISYNCRSKAARRCVQNAGGNSLPDGFVSINRAPGGRLLNVSPPEALAERGNVPMTLTEILALLTFLVTTVYDTIDIVLRFREFRTKNGQKK